VHDLSLEHLDVRAIAGAANNVLATPEHGVELFRRGVLYAPDFVINAGALIHGASFHIDGVPPPPERILQIGTVLGDILDAAAAEGLPPEQVAERMARERIEAAGREGPFLPRCPEARDG
jgi:leucine dehydrogenase